MLFNSFSYFAFLVVTLVVCFVFMKRAALAAFLGALVVASLFFYGYWDPVYLFLIAGSIAFNFLVGRRVARDAGRLGRSPWLWFGVAGNLALLGVFKYTDFVVANVNAVARTSIPLTHIVLPLGISFFTFTQIAFLVDARQGKAKDYSPLSYSLFVTFFPHLLAGPILHHSEMMPQFANPQVKRFDWQNVYAGLFLFAIGLFKKVVIADALAVYANNGYSNAEALGFGAAWTTTLAYTFQLYFDFSGYTDMALGSARMFNCQLPINFNSPYAATSLQDFWHRWHITLSRFLRDYVYIPLGGNRARESKVYRNLFITFLLGGIWHGAGWTFVIWGLVHGLGICVHRWWTRLNRPLPTIVAVALTFLCVHLAWVFFRAESLRDAGRVLRALCSPQRVSAPGFVLPALEYPLIAAIPLALFMAAEAFRWNSMVLLPRVTPSARWTIAIAILLGIAVVLMSGHRPSEFLYFQF